MEIQIPHLEITITLPELECQCGWQGDRKDAEREEKLIEDHGSCISSHTFYFCPQCGNHLDLDSGSKGPKTRKVSRRQRLTSGKSLGNFRFP